MDKDKKYKEIDILAIGDISVDVFIKIKEAEALCDIDGEHCKLCINYGGKIPYESADVCPATGNSSNVAIGISRLGLRSALMTNLGDDKNGDDCINILKKENVDTYCVKKEIDKPTNYHYVLWFGGERTILTKHEKYKYEWTKTKESEEYHSPSWIYLSSLGEDSLDFHNEIVNYLNRHIKVKLAFQPGTFQIKMGIEPLHSIYEKTELFICNHDEAESILIKKEKDISKLIKLVYALGPKIVVITDGENGSYSYDGKDILFMKSFYHKPIETTGAGDSFSSAFLSAIFLGYSISDALIWGTTNASSVVSFIGPHKGLLNKKEIEDYIKDVPDEDKPIILIQ